MTLGALLDPSGPRALVIIRAGQYYVTADREVIATVLGSCVSVCLKDIAANVGGMNHFVLPDGREGADGCRYGFIAMERLLDEMLRRGARLRYLEAKVFGGAHGAGLGASGAQIAASNVRCAEAALARHGIPVRARDVGGRHGRRIRFDVESWRVWVREVGSVQGVAP